MEGISSERKASHASATANPAIANDHKRKPIDDHAVTSAGEITTRQSIVLVALVTILFFM
jgi:FHS family L-fucose permease-like MFS transporter